MADFILCCGMSRSGGTVQYQLIRELIERNGLGKGIGFGSPIARRRPDTRRYDGWIVAKQEIATLWAQRLVRRGKAMAFNIYRDPRDIAVSLMQWRSRQNGRTFDLDGVWRELIKAICWQKAWEQLPWLYSIPYEEARLDWAQMVMEVAQNLGIEIDRGEAEDIAALYSVDNNLVRMEEMTQWMDYGEGSMLTKTHIGEHRGEPEQWRQYLSPEDVQRIESMAGQWMRRRGYL